MKGFKMIQTLITPLSQFLPIFVLLAIIFVVALLLTKKKKYTYAAQSFMTKSERAFFFKLAEALPDFYVFPQVALIELLKPLNFPSKGKILAAHVDFTVFDKALNRCCVVELDGATHNSLKQKQKDKERDEFLAQAGITVLRFKPASKIDFDGLRLQVENLLEKSAKM